jgi:hypothetical protein
MARRIPLALIAALSLSSSVAFAATPKTPPPPPPPAQHFTLRVLEQDWFVLGLGYDTNNKAWKVMEHLPSTDLAHLGEDDIESYDFSCQTITLSPTATQKLRETLSTPPRLKRGDPQRMPVTGLSLEPELYLKVFVVELDGHYLYAGVFLDPVSQMGIDFPVIRIDDSSGARVVFHLAPVQGWSLFVDPQGANDPAIEEIRSALGTPWEDRMKDPKYRTLVNGIWAKLNDPRIEQIFTRTGALKRSGNCPHPQ